MMKWFKIGDDNFSARDIGIQFSMDTSSNNFGYAKIIQQGLQTIDITISVECNTFNKDYFFDLFDKYRQNGSFYKFEISSAGFTANGCVIRTISTDPSTNSIVMNINSDYSSVKPISERRDEIIDEILNETSKK